MTVRILLCQVLFAGLSGTAFIGCGGSSDQPDLGRVTGKVTLDGETLNGVIVVFKPDVGRAATGTTNATGEYELEYLYKTAGCKVGQCKVSLEWPLGASGKAIPAKYSSGTSELTEVVQPGSNTFDLTLVSGDSADSTAAESETAVPANVD